MGEEKRTYFKLTKKKERKKNSSKKVNRNKNDFQLATSKGNIKASTAIKKKKNKWPTCFVQLEFMILRLLTSFHGN